MGFLKNTGMGVEEFRKRQRIDKYDKSTKELFSTNCSDLRAVLIDEIPNFNGHLTLSDGRGAEPYYEWANNCPITGIGEGCRMTLNDYMVKELNLKEEDRTEGCVIVGDRNKLVSVSMPNIIERINNYAFTKCEKLTSIQFSENLEFIGRNAFAGCTSLEEVIIPDSIEGIGINAFRGCSLRKISLPAKFKDKEGRISLEEIGITELTEVIFR